MSYLENVVNERPMLRVAASVIVAFCFAAPLVWLFSNLVVYGLRSVLWAQIAADQYRCTTKSAGFFNSTRGVALQAANAAHGNGVMRKRQQRRSDEHHCHRSNQGHGP
jgi:hypothetical protein